MSDRETPLRLSKLDKTSGVELAPPGAGSSSRSRIANKVATVVITTLGWSAILILAAIAAFLIQNSTRALTEVGLGAMIMGTDWFPTLPDAKFGFLPSEVGSMWVTFVALLLAVPLGVMAAVYLSEFARPRVKEIGKTLVEFMAAVPSVVFGLIGLSVLAPFVAKTFGLDSGLVGLTAGIAVGLVTLPTIISISEDAMHAVPEGLRRGSLALGNTHWQTIYKVVLPSASSGIFAACMLGLGRAIGETMVVLMLAGNAGIIPDSPFLAARTMTGTIAQETGEVVRGGLHFSVLFTMGMVLFVITFAINAVADIILDRQRKKWAR